MRLDPWWQVATPHQDIRNKSFSEAVFAADLGDVQNPTAPSDYRDPRLFFTKTYLTEGLKSLLNNILKRLCHGSGDPVIQLQPPFGGGKTHALLALYHLVHSYNEVRHLDQIQALMAAYPNFQGAKVAIFVGTKADPIHGKTPWGAIAEQFGLYSLVQEHDSKRVSPGTDVLERMLQTAGPNLILIDELLEYVVKAAQVMPQGQILAFLQELSQAVARSSHSVVVLTLPTGLFEQFDANAAQMLTEIQHVYGRMESIYEPVKGTELYEIIRKRLFESLGDTNTHRAVADAYFQLYRELGSEVPAEVTGTEYRDKIQAAYPFHPELLDLLYERWGSFPTFQRTRGVLRLLAQIVGDLYELKTPAPLIHSSMVNLTSPAIRGEFIRYIGTEYDSVISADVLHKAPEIDKEMGSEYARYGIAKALATTIFLYSFSGSERKGMTQPELRVALFYPGFPLNILGDALDKLEDRLWYLHVERRHYSFKNQPNLNRVILERQSAIRDDEIRNLLKAKLQELATRNTSLSSYHWPGQPSDVPDNRALKLAILSPEYREEGCSESSAATASFSQTLIDRAGTAPRIYRNTLFLLVVEAASYPPLERQLRLVLALQDIQDNAQLLLTDSNKADLKRRLQQAQDDLPHIILTAYRFVGWHGPSGLTWKDMGIPTIGQNRLIERVLQFVKQESRVLSHISPGLILDKAFSDTDQEKSLEDIYSIFLRTPGLPCLENESVLVEAVREGVKSGIFGLRQDDRVFFKEDILSEIPMHAYVLKPEIAQQQKAEQTPPTEQETFTYPELPMGSTADMRVAAPPQSSTTTTVSTNTTRLYIQADVPWDQLSLILSGVIRPLRQNQADIKLTIEIQATSQNGFSRMDLDNKVRETLSQIGATVHRWEES